MKTTKVLIIMMAAFFVMSFTVNFTSDPWPVPDKYEKMKSPVEADKDCIRIGERLYNKHCKSCHGKEGLGDGSKAAQLDTPCGDFSSKEFKSQTDGAIFYKSLIGRDEMPNYEKKIRDEEDMWCIVHYMRQL